MSTTPRTETTALIAAMEHWAKTVAKNGGVAAVTIQEGADRLSELKDRAELAEASAKLWEADALRYANNTEFWKDRAEKAEAEVDRQSGGRRSMSAHTPGNWVAGVAPHKGENLFIVGLLGTKKAIALCGKTGAADEQESMANARLIAAAPDLLAALQTIDSNAAESVEFIRRVVRAALAKVEGGTNPAQAVLDATKEDSK